MEKYILYSKGVNKMYWRYVKSARDRNRVFELTRDEFTDFVLSDYCYYCGCKPYQYAYDTLVFGIDRVDNKLGYFFENCVSCCNDCNYSKGRLPIEKFLIKLQNG